ncbi:hypothetical protein LXL04_003215 [Taraxacum kok-saghyz]
MLGDSDFDDDAGNGFRYKLHVLNRFPITIALYSLYRHTLRRKSERERIQRVYVLGLVNKSVDLDCFRLSCSDYYSMSTIGRWIHAAVTRNVKRLEFWFLGFCPMKPIGDVELPHCLVTCGSLEVLELNFSRHGLRLPTIMGFPALRVLDLTCVDLLEDDDLVKDFFERCPLLEDLTLLDCLINKLNHLRLSCQNLKKLEIINLGDEGLCGDIKISCPKLVDLDIIGYTTSNFFFERLDSLKRVVIEPKLEGNTISVLFPGISHVEYLSIDLYFFSLCIKAACDPGLPNLKYLVLTTTIDAFTFDEFIQILKFYPKLEALNLIIKEVFFLCIMFLKHIDSLSKLMFLLDMMKEFYGSEEWELHEGDARRILTKGEKSILGAADSKMASSSGKKKDKGPEKVYVQDSESDGDGVDLSFVDFSQETFKPTLNSCDDPFLNLICDKSPLRSGIDRMRADTNEDVEPVQQVNEELMAMEKQLNIPDLTNEDRDVVRDMIEGGYDADEIAYTLGIVDSGKQVDAEVDAEVPIQKKRRPSERIIKGKLKKFGPNKDGGGSSKDKAWVLE